MSVGRFVAALALLIGIAAPAAAQAGSGLTVGAPAPVVKVNDLDGKPVDLGAYLGKKPVVLEFWATWCGLCEELLPKVKAWHAAYGDQVEWVGINVTVNQTPARVRRYLDSHKPPFRALYDDQGASIRAYEVPSTSYIVVVDRAGKVAYTGLGGEQNLEPVLKQVTLK
jgi:thiol-disulfide isomerase/thioredoxin